MKLNLSKANKLNSNKETKLKKRKEPKEPGLKKQKEPRKGKRRFFLFLIILLALAIFAAIGIKMFVLKGSDAKNLGSIRGEQQKESGKASEKHKKTTALDSSLENHLATDFIKTLNSQQYLIKYKTTTVYNGQSYEVETTYAVSGSGIVLSSGDRSTIVRDGKAYMLNHTDKTILSWDIKQSAGVPKRLDTDGLVYSGSSQENGLVCEEYKTAAEYLRLYFRNKDLVKMVTAMNGRDTVMDISEISKKVPADMFDIPPGYQASEL
jgi:hypothetical protein